MVYLYKTGTMIVPHSDKAFAENTLNLGEPVKILTDAEWEASDCLARFIDGTLVIGKTDTEKTYQKATEARQERDKLLLLSDIEVNKAEDLQDEEAIAKVRIYRQALRDVPGQEGFPTNIIWPVL